MKVFVRGLGVGVDFNFDWGTTSPISTTMVKDLGMEMVGVPVKDQAGEKVEEELL